MLLKNLLANRKGMDAGIFFGGFAVGVIIGIGILLLLGYFGIDTVDLIFGTCG